MSLRDIIIKEIREKGPISFRDYMEMCLYHPCYGYYTSGPSKLGPRGDFYTSPALGSLFGALIANQLEEMWAIMGKNDFVVVEFGGGNGLLCHDILHAIKKNTDFQKRLHYYIIEKDHPSRTGIYPSNITRITGLNDIPPFEGCVISNELVDNFSVHRVVNADTLMEKCVNYQDEHFTETMHPASSEINNYFTELNVSLPRNYHTEVNLQAIEWIKDISFYLTRGFVMTIDYGFPSQELYNSSRSGGNLLCYHEHSRNTDPYVNIGSQDITAHINFSALHHWGTKYGLSLAGFTTQSMFLMGLGISRETIKDPACVGSPLMLRTLLVDMGNRMKVLIQQKNIEEKVLSGMRFPLTLS
jgi:SAM-dependent MidA family methyltransferase